jgi:hypothetical protein
MSTGWDYGHISLERETISFLLSMDHLEVSSALLVFRAMATRRAYHLGIFHQSRLQLRRVRAGMDPSIPAFLQSSLSAPIAHLVSCSWRARSIFALSRSFIDRRCVKSLEACDDARRE